MRLAGAGLLCAVSAWLPSQVALAAASPDTPARAAPASSPTSAPTRVITLAPHITELVFAAGAGARIVGTVVSSNHPPQAREIKRVGDGLLVNTEALLALQPDIVLAWMPSYLPQAQKTVLDASGVAVQYSHPRVLDDIPTEILRFGKLFGTLPAAKAQAQAQRQRIAALRQRYAKRKPVRVFLDLGDTPLYTLGDNPLFNSVLAACGGVNLYAHSDIPAPVVSPESVLAREPDVVLVASDPQAVRPTPWKQLQLEAAQKGRLYHVEPDALLRPGPRLIDATERICAYLDAARPGETP